MARKDINLLWSNVRC